MRLRALKDGGLYLTLGGYPSQEGRRLFSVSAKDAVLYIPDSWADEFRATVDLAVSEGLAEVVEESASRAAARMGTVAGYDGTTLNDALPLEEGLVSVELAFVKSTGASLLEGVDFTVTSGVVTLDTDQSGLDLVFLYTVV